MDRVSNLRVTVVYPAWTLMLSGLLVGSGFFLPVPALADRDTIALVVHGGAGKILKSNMTPETETEYRAKLKEGLMKGYLVLKAGGSSLDAVEATVQIFEDSPLFNAGKGAVFTAQGRNELDASIMDGSTLQAGAVAGVTTIKNPIVAARAVMEQTRHVMLVGEGAEVFAASVGLDIEEPSYFFTQKRWDSLQRVLEREKSARRQDNSERPTDSGYILGTVGALALDKQGNLAAATSTGGMTAKRFGRVGDSPIIGAGTYANENCAVSATGEGEYFIRFTVARDICARAEYQNMTVGEAANEVIHRVLP
jgi:beta-aspartyl-peptidase (threonine type)